MSDLNALRNQFMSLQKNKSTFKLSERTVVEIIMKIANRGKVKLLHTTSGKEYVIDGKVNVEILNEIKKRKRVTTFELSSYLELPLSVIETKVDDLIKKNKNYLLIDGKIMSKEYLDKITNEINDMVTKQGSASLADISNKYDLSIDFLKNFLKEKINEGNLNAKLYPTRIITDYYIQTQIKKIRPLLLANINPLLVSKILNKNKDIDELLIQQNINSLIESGQVKGSLMSNQYENLLYTKAQESYVLGELKQNNYIDYSKLKNIGISKNAEDFVKILMQNDQKDIKGTFLKEYFVTETLVNNLLSIINENESKNLITNLENELSLNLDDEDVKILLESMGIQDTDYIYVNNNYIPMKIINDFIENSKNEIKNIAKNLFDVFAKKFDEEKREEDLKGVNEKADDDKKKNKKKANKNVSNKAENKYKIFLDIKYPREEDEKFLNLFIDSPAFEFMNDKRDTLKEIFDDKISSELKQIFDDEIKELIKLKEKNDNQIDINSHTKNLNNSYVYLKLINENISKIENQFKSNDEKRALKALITHLCKNELSVFLKDLMILEIAKKKLPIDIRKLNNCNEREKTLNLFHEHEIRTFFNNLNNFVDEKNFNDFMKELEKYISNQKIELIYDSVKEKEQINRIKNELKKEVKNDKGLSDHKNYFKHMVFLFNYVLVNKELYFRLPNEFWIFNVCNNLFEMSLFKEGEDFTMAFDEFYKIIKNKKEAELDKVFSENKSKLIELESELQQALKE